MISLERRALARRHLPTILFVATVASPLWIRACQRLDESRPFNAEQREAIVRVARRAVDAAAKNEKAVPVDEPSLQGVAVTTPVFVTVYGPDASHRREPRLGTWEPGDNEMGLPVAEAVTRAASEVGKQVRNVATGAAQVDGTIVKIDVTGPAKRAWLGTWWFLDLVSDPGRDGFRAARGDAHAYSLPSWTIERVGTTKTMLSSLAIKLGETDGSPTIHRFRSTSVVEGPPEEPGAHEVYRGNVLLSEITEPVLRKGLVEAGHYLARQINSEGRFCYNYIALEDRCDADYNLLRHAGTTYSLYQIQAEANEPEMLAAAERAMAWLRKQSRPVMGDASRAFMIEGDRAKLGAVGLSLLALVEREKLVRDGKDLELMRHLANFIVSQQRDDGYMASFFAWKPGLDVPKENSIYYPGEALLGLVRLQGIDPQQKWLDAALRTATFLVKKRWRFAGIELYVPPDAWLTQALAELDAYTQQDWLRDYTYAIVDVTAVSMLRTDEGAAIDAEGGPASGPLFPGVTPAGSRTEGTSAAWRMAKRRGETANVARLRDIALRCALFQLRQQVRPASAWYFPNPARMIGGFRGTAIENEVRIDYVQHNATGLLGVLEMLREKP